MMGFVIAFFQQLKRYYRSNKRVQLMPETTEHTLRLGESATVRPGLLKAKAEVVFAGMVNDGT